MNRAEILRRLNRLPVHPHIWLLVVLAIAAMVRLPAIGTGLPYEYGWDEPEIMLPALRILREGIYIPYKFDYGPLNGFLHAGWGALSFVRGLGQGQFPDGIWGVLADNSTGWYWTVSSPWMLKQARLLSVLLALVSTAFIYLSAYRLWGKVLPAAFAGGIIALNPVYTHQTTLVTSDATSIAAACACIWASIHIYVGRPRWAYVSAGIFAAAAMAFKYNNVFIVVLPVIAHYSGKKDDASGKPIRPQWNNLVRYSLWFGCAAVVFMFPVFLKPTRFLHDIATVLGFYTAPLDSSVVSVIGGYVKRGLSLLDMGTVSAPGKSMTSVKQIGFSLNWYGIGVVSAVAMGALLSCLHNRRLFLLLFPIVALNFINIGGDTGFFFPRYLLLSLPLLALFGGYAAHTLPQIFTFSSLPRWSIPALFAILIVPYAYHTIANTREMAAKVDPRSKMADYLEAKVPRGQSLLILEETRWHVTQEEGRAYKIKKSTVPQLLQAPDMLKGVDYLIAPRSVLFHEVTPAREQLVSEINTWLAGLRATRRFGSFPIAFDGPDVGPAVQLVDIKSLSGVKAQIPENSVYGMAFSTPGAGGTVLGNGVLGIRPGYSVTALMRVTTNSERLIVRAQGTAPYQQEEAPSLSVTLVPQGGAALPTAVLTLGRSQSGIQEYTADQKIATGLYQISVRAQDKDAYLVRLESISVAQ